jgi:glycosyltransferase involved in cell wall biosynthesis
MTMGFTASRMMHLARNSIRTVRHDGWRAFYATLRRKLLPATVEQAAWRHTYIAQALRSARRFDFAPSELERSRALMALHHGPLAIDTIHWYLPGFDHAYYGGVHTVLRFAASFATRHAARNTFVVLGTPTRQAIQTYTARIGAAFPALAGTPVILVGAYYDLTTVQPADVCVATHWTTAYYVLKFNQTRRKFYFMQDFEPMFYPAGSTSAQAEATYYFGFYGLANTITLQQHYCNNYQGSATVFTPCVDTHVFYPASEQQEDGSRPYQVFFYARPDYWRNGFELAVSALRQLKERLGKRVRVVSAGQQWNPADYGLAGVVENQGLLSYQDTARLYRTCDVGLVLMFTRHPSYLPFELMASGCLVVSNVNNATSWLLKDEENCLLSLPSASCIADTLARGLHDRELRHRITAHALRLIGQQFSDWDQQIDHAYHYMCDPEAPT